MTPSTPQQPDPLEIVPSYKAAECAVPDHIALDLDPSEGEDAATVAAPQSVPPPLPTGAEVFLNTATIRESDAPNRDESAYADAAYVQFRANIQQMGRNIAAIKNNHSSNKVKADWEAERFALVPGDEVERIGLPG